MPSECRRIVPSGCEMTTRAAARSQFFYFMTWAFLAIALIGFSTTFFIPLVRGSLGAPLIIHVHGALLFAWLLLLIVQSSLIRNRQLSTHRKYGWAGTALCTGILVSGALLGFHVTRRDLGTGNDAFVLGQLVNILIELLVFGGFVAAAIWNRRDGETHKRLLLLATISALAPAWLRFRHFLPAVSNPIVIFSLLADSLLLVAIARDVLALNRIHPGYVWAGGAMVAVHLIEFTAMKSAPWLAMAQWLLNL